jgi:uncharacterized protein (UPF0332 family)
MLQADLAVYAQLYSLEATESLAGAERELADSRFNNCANRCYYSCFQAAIAALLREGMTPPGRGGEWSHAHVQAQFAGTLIARRKLYPSDLRDVLSRAMVLRQTADYKVGLVTRVQAERMVRATQGFLAVTQPGADIR